MGQFFGIITIASDMRTPAVGDWICDAGETPVPQLPPELHPALALAVAVQYLRPIDPDTSRDLREQLAEALAMTGALLRPRQQGVRPKIRPRSSFMRRGMGGRRGTFDDFGDG